MRDSEAEALAAAFAEPVARGGTAGELSQAVTGSYRATWPISRGLTILVEKGHGSLDQCFDRTNQIT